MKKILIVGGVAGGATIAARLRRLNEENEIILFERGEYISFATCGLPYYIGDVIEDRERLLVQTVEGMSSRFNLDIRNFSEVTNINREKQEITVKDLKKDKTYTEHFDQLILSPGAKPLTPSFKGLKEAENIFTLRNVPDADRIKEEILCKKHKKAVVIGGGFVGVEIAENLRELNLDVTIVEKLPQVFRQLDFEMAQIIHRELNANCVNLILNDGIDHFEEKGQKLVLESGTILEADLVILAIGVCPENNLAKTAQLKIGPRGHIVTNKFYETIDLNSNQAVENIFAIGDAIEVKDFVDNCTTAIPLAGPANHQARILADHIMGRKIRPSNVQGTAAAKVFTMTLASTGNNEEQVKTKNLPYKVIHAHRDNHAGYYPGATNIALKLIFNPENGKIYGAQAVGQDGVVKRIDVISSAMRMGATIYDLQDLELCYAPPFSSAKDPVNILGYMAENMIESRFQTVQWNEIDKIIDDGGFILDVRTAVEIAAGSLKNSVHIPAAELRKNLSKLPTDKNTPIYVYCRIGLTGYMSTQVLNAHGYKFVYNLSGGYETYKLGNYKLSKQNFDSNNENKINQHSSYLENNKENITIVNVEGLQCPGPLMATYKAIKKINEGEMVQTIATDFGFVQDIENWCQTNGHTLLSKEKDGNKYICTICKGNKKDVGTEKKPCSLNLSENQKNATMVVFSGDLDKALASMIIAQGAAAQGKDVTLFFTFWGLNILRKKNSPAVKKNFIEKMFGKMMPKGASKLTISQMNMLGMGTKMIKSIMKKKNVDDLETMIRNAQDLGVRFIACTMSMELMGIKKEELLDNIEYAGVGSYIAANENAGTTLFI